MVYQRNKNINKFLIVCQRFCKNFYSYKSAWYASECRNMSTWGCSTPRRVSDTSLPCNEKVLLRKNWQRIHKKYFRDKAIQNDLPNSKPHLKCKSINFSDLKDHNFLWACNINKLCDFNWNYTIKDVQFFYWSVLLFKKWNCHYFKFSFY